MKIPRETRPRPTAPPVYRADPSKMSEADARSWGIDDVLDSIFFAIAAVATLWLAWLLIGSGWHLEPLLVVNSLLFWAVLAYLALPRLHQVLTWLYVPDYFIGRTRTADGLLGDPVNLAVRGDEEDIHEAMEAAGWVRAEPITLRTLPHSGHRRSQVRQVGAELWISGPAAHDDALLKAAVHAWLKKFAAELFHERMQPFVQKLGRAPSRVSLNAARTRWGSCSRDGSIRLNWRLVQYAPELIDYVIAHELAHLTELNHSPRFWAQLEALMPDYRQWQRQLADTPDALVE